MDRRNVWTGMEGTERAYARRVQIRYETRGYGLALAIVDDLDDRRRRPKHDDGPGSDGPGDKTSGPGFEVGDGVLTVGETGVTTLELRRSDGSPSFLIWDAAEVDWDSLRAG